MRLAFQKASGCYLIIILLLQIAVFIIFVMLFVSHFRCFRLDTDIHLGRVSGLCTVCVMSGVTSEAVLTAARADPAKAALLSPDLVYPSVLELYQQLLEEDKKTE